MPTYVYECSSCNTQFEAFQRITEDPLTSCDCGATGTVKRVIQPIAVMFKGSGFHINDYAAKGNEESKSESTPESKPETPAATPAAPATPTSPAATSE